MKKMSRDEHRMEMVRRRARQRARQSDYYKHNPLFKPTKSDDPEYRKQKEEHHEQ